MKGVNQTMIQFGVEVKGWVGVGYGCLQGS